MRYTLPVLKVSGEAEEEDQERKGRALQPEGASAYEFIRWAWMISQLMVRTTRRPEFYSGCTHLHQLHYFSSIFIFREEEEVEEAEDQVRNYSN